MADSTLIIVSVSLTLYLLRLIKGRQAGRRAGGRVDSKNAPQQPISTAVRRLCRLYLFSISSNRGLLCDYILDYATTRRGLTNCDEKGGVYCRKIQC